MILSVDLASRFSAAVALDRDARVATQFDSWLVERRDFVDLVAERADETCADLIVIEDVPYGISRQSMVKPVLRLQGRLIERLDRGGLLDRVVFVAPATWQRHFGLFRAKNAAKVQAEKAEELGYTPPDLRTLYAPMIPPKGDAARTRALDTVRKAATDYVAAYLIARWAHEVTREGADILTLQGVQEP